MANSDGEENIADGTTPGEWAIVAGDEELIYIECLRFYLRGTGVLTAATFGTIAELSNGMALEFRRGGKKITMTNGRPIKNNGEISQHAGPSQILEKGAADNQIAFKWDIPGPGLALRPGDSLVTVFNDDVSGLSELTIKCEGSYLQGSQLS
jgi:hypothetical protein